jgi:hypothetical protein
MNVKRLNLLQLPESASTQTKSCEPVSLAVHLWFSLPSLMDSLYLPGAARPFLMNPTGEEREASKFFGL